MKKKPVNLHNFNRFESITPYGNMFKSLINPFHIYEKTFSFVFFLEKKEFECYLFNDEAPNCFTFCRDHGCYCGQFLFAKN